MSIVKQTNKKTGITYVYESHSYWDPEKKQARSKRKLIGKLDPVTGDIIPTGKKGPKKKSEETKDSKQEDVELAKLKKEVMDQKRQIADLQKEVESLTEQNRKLKRLIDRIKEIIAS